MTEDFDMEAEFAKLDSPEPQPPKAVVVKKKKKRFNPGPIPKNIPGEAPVPTDTRKFEVYQLYLLGIKPAEITKSVGVANSHIYHWINKYKWDQRKDYYDRLKSRIEPEHERPIVRAVIEANRDEMRKKFLASTGKMAVEDAEAWAKMKPKERLEVATAIAPLNKVHRDNLDLNKEESGPGTGGHISLTFLSQADQPGMVKVIDVHTETQRIEDKEE